MENDLDSCHLNRLSEIVAKSKSGYCMFYALKIRAQKSEALIDGGAVCGEGGFLSPQHCEFDDTSGHQPNLRP